jgi:heme/copper-type cytochrome/quinol oxidase subunit 2
MQPLLAIGLVFFAVIAWTVTILTMLIVIKARRRPPAQISRAVHSVEIQSSDERAA